MDRVATRREKVVLELQDDFTTGMAKAAAAAALLHKELEGLDGSGRRSSTSIDRTSRSTRTLGKDVEDTGRKVDRAEKSIDKFSGRLRVFGDIAAILAPTIAPIGALAIPAISGLASEFGFAAVGAGTMIAAFQGVGDALKAVNKAALEPTAENLDAARLAMSQIGPDAQRLVRELRDFEPALKGLRDTAAAGMFPGLVSGLDELESRLPDVQRILRNVSETLGTIAADSGASLASGRWDDFFKFIATDAPPALASMARAAGNTAHALAELWMAFDPLNDDVISWLEKASNDFDEWAGHLSESKGFHEFIDYVRQTGPQVAETFAAIGNAVLQIVEAGAPLGGPILSAIEGIAKALGAIADSNAGPTIMAAVTAMALLSRGQAVFASVSERSWVASIRGAETFSGKLAAARMPLLKSGAALVGLGLASSGLADKFDLTNTASLALIGTLGGPWGAAVGGAVGLALDLGKTHEKVATDVQALTATLNQQTGAITENTQSWTAHNLETQGVLKAAAALGLSLSDVTQAALGNGDALDRVNTGLVNAKDGFYNADGTIKVGADTLRTYGDNMHLVKDAIGGSNKALTDGQGRIRRMADATGKAAGSTNAMAAATRRSAAALVASRSAARDTARSFLDISKNATNAKVSLAAWIRQMASQADALNHFATNAQKAADKGLRHGLIAALQKLGPEGALRMRQLANATDAEIAKANRAWAKGQRAIHDYTNAVGGVPKKAGTTLILYGADKAIAQSEAVRRTLNSLNGTTAKVYLETVRGDQKSARGNIFHYAYGDVANRHMPELAGPGPTRVWREPETQGEAYIPLANDDRRPRARQIAAETVSLLGGTAYFAAGGLSFARRRHPDDDPSPHLRNLSKALREATKSLNKEKAARDRLISKRSDLSGSVRDTFLSDPFGEQNVWAAGGGNPTAILKADIAKARAFKASLAQLKKSGLDGDALASLEATGDIGKAQALLGLGKSGIGQYESAFKTRAAAAASVGQFAGNAAYGAQITAQTHHLATLTHEVKTLKAQLAHQHHDAKKGRKANAHETGKAVANGVNKAATRAQRANR